MTGLEKQSHRLECERYTTFTDPCGLHIIWDELAVEPATVNGRILAFSLVQGAHTFAHVLNQRDRMRRDGRSVTVRAMQTGR